MINGHLREKRKQNGSDLHQFFHLCPRAKQERSPVPVEISLISNKKIQLQAVNQTGQDRRQDWGRIVQGWGRIVQAGFDALVHDVRQDQKLQRQWTSDPEMYFQCNVLYKWWINFNKMFLMSSVGTDSPERERLPNSSLPHKEKRSKNIQQGLTFLPQWRWVKFLKLTVSYPLIIHYKMQVWVNETLSNLSTGFT